MASPAASRIGRLTAETYGLAQGSILVVVQPARRARTQVAQRHGADRRPEQVGPAAPDRAAHRPHLPAPALPHHELEHALAIETACLERAGPAVIEPDTGDQPLELAVRRRRRHRHPVSLAHPETRVRHAVCQVAVGGEQQKAAAVDVEAAHGTSPGIGSMRSITVRRRRGSRRVVTTPAGLCIASVTATAAPMSAPSTRTRSAPGETVHPTCPTWPLTVTRPAAISSSAPRLEATPRRERNRLRRSGAAALTPAPGRARPDLPARHPPAPPEDPRCSPDRRSAGSGASYRRAGAGQGCPAWRSR